MPTVYNAANEKAVELFLNEKIPYLRIAELIGEAMERHQVVKDPALEEILEVETWTCEYVAERVLSCR